MLLRVVVTISNVAASAVAAVSEPVTQRTGLFMLAAFAASAMKMIFWRRRRRYAQAGNGRCVLIVSSVKVIIRHTDSAIASDAATA